MVDSFLWMILCKSIVFTAKKGHSLYNYGPFFAALSDLFIIILGYSK